MYLSLITAYLKKKATAEIGLRTSAENDLLHNTTLTAWISGHQLSLYKNLLGSCQVSSFASERVRHRRCQGSSSLGCRGARSRLNGAVREQQWGPRNTGCKPPLPRNSWSDSLLLQHHQKRPEIDNRNRQQESSRNRTGNLPSVEGTERGEDTKSNYK